MKSRFRLVFASLPFLAGIFPSAGQANTITGLSLLGSASIAHDATSSGHVVGGLSGLAHVGGTSFRAISDSSSNPRIFDLDIDISGGLTAVSTGSSPLTQAGGDAYPSGTVDAEGIAITSSGGIYIADEGTGGNPSAIRIYNSAQEESGAQLPPSQFIPGAGNGVRANLGFESLTLSPNGLQLTTATEQALVQDGPQPTAATGTQSRLLRMSGGGSITEQFVYLTEPLVNAVSAPTGLPDPTNGLVELIALDNAGKYLAMERSLSYPGLFGGALYEIDTASATDVSGVPSLTGSETPVAKQLLFDLSTLGFPLANFEGMAFGDWIDADTRSLVLIGDNNFELGIDTQIVALAVDFETTAVPLPASLGFLLGGVAVLSLRSRRRR